MRIEIKLLHSMKLMVEQEGPTATPVTYQGSVLVLIPRELRPDEHIAVAKEFGVHVSAETLPYRVKLLSCTETHDLREYLFEDLEEQGFGASLPSFYRVRIEG